MKGLLLFLCFPFSIGAQIQLSYTVNTHADTHAISPFIFGSCNGGYNQATFRRLGGNRLTGFNWENGASNAGADYFHQSDDYLLFVQGIPSINYNTPGIVVTDFHDESLLMNAESAITLQMAGYVAKDRNGTSVSVAETAPSIRWNQVINNKPTALALNPDLNDNVVYTDEFINFLINQYGLSSSSSGIKAFIMDNEPGLWPSTHPRIHPSPNNCLEHLSKSIALASTIRSMDSTVEIWGPESYGYYEYKTFQDGSDWNTYSGQYSHYLAVYLDSLQHASQLYGQRLLNTLTVHWYPDVYAGQVYSADVTPAIAHERMQIPRSLWDSTYTENSWIGQYYGQDLPILPKLKNLIQTYYPGTKLGVTEYDYGADFHISGGIAEVEALSAFARTGTSYASKWGTFSDYSLSAIQLFRNVSDPFGSLHVYSQNQDHLHSGIVASVATSELSDLHLMVTNKDDDSTILAHFNISSGISYDSIHVYWFDAQSFTIQSQVIATQVAQNGSFDYTLQPLAAYHFVLKAHPSTTGIVNQEQGVDFTCYPNPVQNLLLVSWKAGVTGELELVDVLGKVIQLQIIGVHENSFQFNTEALKSGVYYVRFKNENGQALQTIVK